MNNFVKWLLKNKYCKSKNIKEDLTSDEIIALYQVYLDEGHPYNPNDVE